MIKPKYFRVQLHMCCVDYYNNKLAELGNAMYYYP